MAALQQRETADTLRGQQLRYLNGPQLKIHITKLTGKIKSGDK